MISQVKFHILIIFLEHKKICGSYYEIGNLYPHIIASGRNEKTKPLLNDKFISVPCGSEDDKNPLKKNQYEENIFRFEEQRYELDMVIEIRKSVINRLEDFMEKMNKNPNQTIENIEKELGKQTIRNIKNFYKEYGSQIVENLQQLPLKTGPVIINRFRKRLEETLAQKQDLEKNIKISFDRYYSKSFDHLSLKYKHFEKKNTNPKAIIKEIQMKRSEKLNSNDLNILKGGMEGNEFYSTLPIKQNYLKENIEKILNNHCNSDSLFLNYSE